MLTLSNTKLVNIENDFFLPLSFSTTGHPPCIYGNCHMLYLQWRFSPRVYIREPTCPKRLVLFLFQEIMR